MPTETKSPLLEGKIDIIEPPKYTDTELTYLKGLHSRLETARDARDQSHTEFDGMDYLSYFNQNQRLANTYVEPKKNKEDSNFQSGTIRTKLLALLAPIVNLDLSPDISAFDKNGFRIQSLGDAAEDIILKTDEVDNDADKKFLREYELLVQGDVFVEEVWDKRSKKEKKLDGKFTGQLTEVKWKTKLKEAFARPSRNIIPGTHVYLGDITKYNIADQPYIFTVDTMPYSEAERVFGSWERWDNVPKTLTSWNALTQSGDWTVLQIDNGYVEVVRYQDKWENEFAVLLNGVLMTPVGLPLPWGYEDYNITQQHLEPIHSKFAYGKSLVFKIRNKVAILDEMMKLAVLKTQKSFMPPYINISGRILSNRVFMPGKLTHGIPPNSLVPISDKETQGLTNAELVMIKEVQESINLETTSPQFQGQPAGGNPTATEIIELQRQAKQMLGLTIFAMSMLEWKLSWLRLQNLLANWFNPEDTILDDMRGEIKSKYRQVSVARPIDGEGMGMRMVVPTKEKLSPAAVMQAEDIVSKEQGMPVRFIFINPDEVTSSKYCWQIVVRPREKRTSETEKLMFRAEFADAQVFGPQLNMEYMQEKFASVWNENPKKMFKSPDQVQAEQMKAAGAEATDKTLAPGVNLPSPEAAAGRAVKQGLIQ